MFCQAPPVKVFMMLFFFSFFFEKICSFTKAFTLDLVKSLLENNSIYKLRNAESVISEKFEKSPLITQRKLYECLTKTVKREILSERDVHDVTEKAIALGKRAKLYVFSQLLK